MSYTHEVLERSLRNILGKDYHDTESVFYNLGRAEARYLILQTELKLEKEKNAELLLRRNIQMG